MKVFWYILSEDLFMPLTSDRSS